MNALCNVTQFQYNTVNVNISVNRKKWELSDFLTLFKHNKKQSEDSSNKQFLHEN